jgi:hypothetical protein
MAKTLTFKIWMTIEAQLEDDETEESQWLDVSDEPWPLCRPLPSIVEAIELIKREMIANGSWTHMYSEQIQDAITYYTEHPNPFEKEADGN